MAAEPFYRRAWRDLRFATHPILAILAATTLLVISIFMAIHNENLAREQKVRETMVQARILAASVTAALAFDDRTAAQEYVNALRINADVGAAGAYDGHGRLSAGFGSATAPLPATNRLAPPVIEGRDLIVTAPVVQGATQLGSVYLRSATESGMQRALRYVGIAAVVIMACLLVAVLGTSYASLAQAHRRLQEASEAREKAEEALRQAQKMEAMGQLTGGVAHDFNNLLMIASSGLELLERTDDPVRQMRLRESIRQAIDRGAKLTKQLLTFARRSPLKPRVIDLGQSLSGLRDLLERSLREDIIVTMDIAADAWPVELDPSQLEVAILNIALNARDAMPDGGGIAIRVENQPAAGEAGRDMVRLSIADTGTGVPAAMIPKMVEPFFTTKGVGQGTGLGLSQVYGFARSSGGDVEIASVLGEGTEVSLLLPRSARLLPVARAAVRDASTPTSTTVLSVLLVEDDMGVAEVVGAMLAELKCWVTQVPSVQAALEKLHAGARFDLVLSDMVMPGELGGLDLAHLVATGWPALPVILTTGYSDAATAATFEGIRLLEKPYTLERLAQALRDAVVAR
jgi:signal transduction histidine kinase